MRYMTGKYAFLKHVHVSFSPEVLQAEAMKGLMVEFG